MFNSISCNNLFRFIKQENIMQELIEARKDTFLYSQLLTAEEQRQKLKCPNKIQAHFVCVNSECQVPGLMCMDSICECRKTHSKCYHIQLETILKSIEKHRKQIPQNIRKSYQTVHQLINQMIEKLSKIKEKLYLEQTHFGLSEQEMSFTQLINQQKIEKICGKTINSLEKTLKTEINFTIDSNEIIRADFNAKRGDFDSFCQYIQKNYMKYQISSKNKQFLADSKIVKQSHKKECLQNWLSKTLDQKILQSKLLFRASEHNFSAQQFHKHCDAFSNTLVIVITQFGKIIGGFNPNKWQCYTKNSQFIFDKTGKAFMFSLNLKQKYKCLKPEQSVSCHKSYGPIFGIDDLVLSDKANQDNNSYSNFPHSYNLQLNDTNIYQESQQTYTLLSGATDGTDFKVKQYQVYQIKQI